MKLKTLTLSVLLALAGAPALAQTAPNQTAPTPVVVPALPPTVPAPTNAAPNPPPPDIAPSAPVAPVLLPTAQPGTSAEYLQTTRISFKVLDLSLEARPGKTSKPADLAAANKKLQAQRGQIERAMNQATLTQSGKMFTRVLPPVNGNTVLLTTSVINLPGSGGSSAGGPQKLRAVNVGVTLTYNPAGQVVDASISSSDPVLEKFYKALDFKTLIQSAQGSGMTSLYGLPLVQGLATITNATVPTQGLVQALSGLIGKAGQVGASGQASPLTTRTTTTYTGQDAAGNFSFTQVTTADPWKVKLNIGDLSLDMQLSALTGGGVSVLRPDGLTFSSSIKQDISMRLSFDTPGDPYRTVMQVQSSTSVTVALKK